MYSFLKLDSPDQHSDDGDMLRIKFYSCYFKHNLQSIFTACRQLLLTQGFVWRILPVTEYFLMVEWILLFK